MSLDTHPFYQILKRDNLVEVEKLCQTCNIKMYKVFLAF
jgi:hypothetical protein